MLKVEVRFKNRHTLHGGFSRKATIEQNDVELQFGHFWRQGLVLGRSSDAGDVDSPYLLMSPVSAAVAGGAISSGNPISGNSIIGRLLASGESTGTVSSNNSVIPSSASEGPYAHMEFNAQIDKNR